MNSTTPQAAIGPDEIPPVQAHRFRTLMVAILLLVSLLLLPPSDKWGTFATAFMGASVMGIALWRIGRQTMLFWVGAPLLVLAIAGGGLIAKEDPSSVGGSPFHAPFFLFASVTVLLEVLRSKRVTEDTLFGSASAYLLISLAFASTYEAVEFFHPGAVHGIDREAGSSIFSQLSYFSLVTLTTLGYGDMAPIHPFCQSLAVVESVIGVMFPALVVARIIAVHAAEDGGTLTPPERETTHQAVVARIMFFFLPAIVLTLPWVDRTVWGRPLAGFFLFSIIASGVYFVSQNRWVLVGGITAASFCGLLRLAGGAFDTVASVLEVTAITIVVVQLSLWCFRHHSATASVILTATSIYWLIGLAFSGTYQMVLRMNPDAISSPSLEPVGATLYFSFMTLTTTGYGDFTPVAAATRALASAEAFIGIFYPALVIAKLVSLYGNPPD